MPKGTKFKKHLEHKLSTDDEFLFYYVSECLSEWKEEKNDGDLFRCFNQVMIAREKGLCPLDKVDEYWDEHGTKSI